MDSQRESRSISTLEQEIDAMMEHRFDIRSNDLFRPQLKQIGTSLFETKDHYVPKGRLTIVPTTSTLKFKESLIHVITENNCFKDYDLLKKRKFLSPVNLDPSGFVFLINSMNIPFCIKSEENVTSLGDVLIVLPYQPTFLLTIANDKDNDLKAKRYNTCIARGLCMSMIRFMDEGFKFASGLITPEDLTNPDQFKTCLEKIVESSSKFVTFNSLSMNITKYDKVLTAFWASISETKVIPLKDNEAKHIRFLTKEQSIVLVENFSKSNVEIFSLPKTGTTVLLAEVARRLSYGGKTLFVCEEEDFIKYRNHLPGITTCNDFRDIDEDLDKFSCVVNDTSNTLLPGAPKILWKRHKIEKQPSNSSVSTDKREKRLLEDKSGSSSESSRKKMRVSDNLQQMNLNEGENQETQVHINDVDGNEVIVNLLHMEFSRERLNTKRCHITVDNELVNSPTGNQENVEKEGTGRAYSRLWGTSSDPLDSSRHGSFYWEVHGEIKPEDRLTDKTWEPIIEFGIVRESQVDQRVWSHQVEDGKGSWCLFIKGCKIHNQQFCIKTTFDGSPSCTPENIKITDKTIFKFGILVDVSRKFVAFRDVQSDVHLGSGRIESDERLIPVYATNYLRGHVKKPKIEINAKIVSGSDIRSDERLKNFLCEVYHKEFL